MKELQQLTAPTLQSYCNRHGYRCVIGQLQPGERAASWYKLGEIMREFGNGADYVLWVDSDAIIVNQNFRIESFIKPDKEFYVAYTTWGINCGVMLFRNTSLNRDIIVETWLHPEFAQHDWCEQRIMMHLLDTRVYPNDRVEILDEDVFNSPEFWGGCFVYHMAGMTNEQRLKELSKILPKLKKT